MADSAQLIEQMLHYLQCVVTSLADMTAQIMRDLGWADPLQTALAPLAIYM